jgi:uncharacterized Fe-S cluster protein YjdI
LEDTELNVYPEFFLSPEMQVFNHHRKMWISPSQVDRMSIIVILMDFIRDVRI